MNNGKSQNGQINSVLSFEKVFQNWKEIIAQGRPGLSAFYSTLLSEVEAVPALLKPISDLQIIRDNQVLVEKILATVFPITVSDTDDYYAASVPFTFQTVFSSSLFQKTFLNDAGDYILVPDPETEVRLRAEKIASAYQLILKKLFDLEVNGDVRSIHPYTDPRTQLTRHMEVEIDTRFIKVYALSELPTLPEEYKEEISQVANILHSPEIMEWLPLDLFAFEGLSLVHVRDVTEREIINNIKNTLLNLDSFPDVDTFTGLQDQVQALIGLPGIHIGITPFLQINEELAFLEIHNSTSMILKGIENQDEKKEISTAIHKIFRHQRKSLVTPAINADTIREYPFLKNLQDQGWCCSIIWPLYSGHKFLGTMEIVTSEPDLLNNSILQKAEPAIGLFELALRRTEDNLEAKLDKVIKEQFTAVQSSVEWRFVKAALNYISRSEVDEDVKIETIVFDDVYPLYGAIDIRNSSTERNAAIQKDMLEQLTIASNIIRKARKQLKFPLLKETAFKIRKHMHAVTNIILSDDEVSIQNFFKREIVQLFNHLREIEPALKDDIDAYFASISSKVDMVYHHRRMFDESLTRINNTLARFVDREQLEAQKIFPHYFERFVTDGVDFNIYLGQSICPDTHFDSFYLKNIKLWQLILLVKAARLSRKLESQLSLPLQTTQLILANSNPISISFRQAERKFDVDGAYNIRYEIIKKRIDKVHIKDTNERLTKPGTIAIVYAQPQEAGEYMQYIEFMQNEGLLTDKVEKFDLEELQGVIGLKALRAEVLFDEQQKNPELPIALKEKASGQN